MSTAAPVAVPALDLDHARARAEELRLRRDDEPWRALAPTAITVCLLVLVPGFAARADAAVAPFSLVAAFTLLLGAVAASLAAMSASLRLAHGRYRWLAASLVSGHLLLTLGLVIGVGLWGLVEAWR